LKSGLFLSSCLACPYFSYAVALSLELTCKVPSPPHLKPQVPLHPILPSPSPLPCVATTNNSTHSLVHTWGSIVGDMTIMYLCIYACLHRLLTCNADVAYLTLLVCFRPKKNSKYGECRKGCLQLDSGAYFAINQF
jgi:hypothetical protein